MPPVSVLIIDDHRLVADGLSLNLSRLIKGVKVTTSNSVRAVLADEPMIKRQDLVLVDIHMPSIDGFGFLSALENREIKVPVVVISAVENRSDIERVFRMGARGFIPKNAPSDELLKGIRAVLDNQIYVPEHLTGTLNWMVSDSDDNPATAPRIDGVNLEPIRERQTEVLKLIKDGYSNTDIATVLNLTESTVKSHVSTLFKALGVKNRTACVRVAIDLGIIKE